MLGLMQHRELLISSILDHAARYHGDGEVISVRDDNSVDRTTYAAISKRARKLATALRGLGVKPGDRVATLAMNSDRHLELYYGISGIQAVYNTINPRLAAADIAYIVDHAEDGLIFVDPGFIHIIETIAPEVAGALRAVVVLCEEAAMPAAKLPPGMALLCYETLLAGAEAIPAWPSFDERSAAGLCYTSGTTGKPKGALYTHRSSVIHTLMLCGGDVAGLRAVDRVMPMVPMFHVNAWGYPFGVPMTGGTLIMPGRHLDPPSVLKVMNAERVTIAAGVPTLWLNLLNHLRETGGRLETLERVLVGGAAMPRALIEAYQDLGMRVSHGWGMTESSSVATWGAPKPATLLRDRDGRIDEIATQGRPVYGIDVRAVDGQGNEVPWDGRTQGELSFQGHWVARAYYRKPETDIGDDGWFPTGDVGVFDSQGNIKLTDRTKDLIKSGGEWISSIDIENIAVGHPDVLEAAAIAIPDDRWGERPLLIIVPRAGCTPDPAAIRDFYRGKVAGYAIPDRVEVVASIPHGATGKILKTELRKMFAK
jgi:fatty-acyl-CoA synthase